MLADQLDYVIDVRYDVDNDCRWDTRIWNSVGADTFLESLTFDMDENQRWEYWLADTDQREGFDIAFFDDDEDGAYDRWAWIPKTRRSERSVGHHSAVGRSAWWSGWRGGRGARCGEDRTATATDIPI